jgi:hypothetical protein
VKFHIHATPAENYAFSFETKPLLEGGITAQLDFSACAQDAMPGQSEGAMQGPSHSPGGAGISRGAGYVSIGRNLSAGDFANCRQDVSVHGLGHGFILTGFLSGQNGGFVRLAVG